MQTPGESWDGSSRRTFLKQIISSLLLPRDILQIPEVTVAHLISHVKTNIQSELLWWFLENECEWDFFSLILLKNAQIDIKVPEILDTEIVCKARDFLANYDSMYASLDDDSKLSWVWENSRKLSQFLSSLIDDIEENNEMDFTWVKDIIAWKRKEILQALKMLPPKLWKTLRRHEFWVDELSPSHLADFQRQFLVEILWNDPWDRVLNDQDYHTRLKIIDSFLGEMVANERPSGHYHDRYIHEDRMQRKTKEYSRGKWSTTDFKNVPEFLQTVSQILSEKN